MLRNGYENGVGAHEEFKPTYALEHLATFKVKHESEVRNPAEKLKVLMELDKTGGIWPQKMYMCISEQWLLMLDSDMKEIENFPGALITKPTAFISDDPLEAFNNILIFTVPGVSLGNTEMHIFQVSDVSAIHLVEDLEKLSKGQLVTVDRNKNPIKLPKNEKQMHTKDQYGLAVAAAEVAAEKNALDREQTERDVQVLNHCFEDIERFVARLHYAAEALHELNSRQSAHNEHGDGLLVLRSRPPLEREFIDILAKIKLALNYIVKLQNHFDNSIEPIRNIFTSCMTIVDVCNDVHVGANIPENVVNPLLRRETVTFLSTSLNVVEIDFWKSLGTNWNVPKDQFRDHRGSYHPIFYDDWSPDWVVDEEVPYLPPVKKTIPPPSPKLDNNVTWLTRLKSRNVKIAEVLYNKSANNDKELSVLKGEYLEIIDDSRNWWKARNSAGTIGYVPHTVLTPHNFEQQATYLERDTDSLSSSVTDPEVNNNIPITNNNTNNYRHTLTPYEAPTEPEIQQKQQMQQQLQKQSMARSHSMPIVPIPPPLPPPDNSQPTTPTSTPTDTLKRNMAAAGTIAAMRARNDYDASGEALMLQGTVTDEMKAILQQRERRRDLEILVTPQIYINQGSSSREVEEWLRGKGFSDAIVSRLRTLNGAEMFALTPHVIESYFGRKDSRRLISQIVLQKNICEYKTIRSSELSAKLAKARQKADQKNNPDEIF